MGRCVGGVVICLGCKGICLGCVVICVGVGICLRCVVRFVGSVECVMMLGLLLGLCFGCELVGCEVVDVRCL